MSNEDLMFGDIETKKKLPQEDSYFLKRCRY